MGRARGVKWVALERYFDYHAKLVGRFREAGGDAVCRMWSSQTNEDGKPLSHFERKALVERHCELFGTWPHRWSVPDQHQDLDARVGERIRSRREDLGLARTQLAGVLDIDQGKSRGDRNWGCAPQSHIAHRGLTGADGTLATRVAVSSSTE